MLWVKALHIIFMVTWFAGLFYLPRLFVYHADTQDALSDARFKIMERRLMVMTHLGGSLTLVFGLWLLLGYGIGKGSDWMHGKLTLVFLLLIYHHLCMRHVKQFARNLNQHSAKYYRWFNEVPSVLLIGIVLLVVIKPF
ncbi:protoporphyrinogen oxidase HemJ [Parvibium lacunae]|uniref:Protoporphyrinogen IX oxidase n=1 Tax=Parvibium lacunae TaxID=1888893 RepID=A0A368L3W0_9BURK|nr:protoporphyrinogen oxidase HemJ [Parvibium lacunae]RCS58268.1 protoporphyrinogen oxidase HemJ [Parvibium lacunae]